MMDKNAFKEDLLVGTWFNGDDSETDVEYHISKENGHYCIRAIDPYDEEEADVFEVEYKDNILSFATHWNSNGRLLKCRIRVLSENRIDFTYTYSNQELWHRKKD